MEGAKGGRLYVRAEEPVSAPIDDELALFSSELGKYFLLNEVAAAIWELLEAPVSLADVCTELQRRFEVSPERCRSEVEGYLDRLLQAGLVRET